MTNPHHRLDEKVQRYERWRLTQYRFLAVLFSLLMLWALLSTMILMRLFLGQAGVGREFRIHDPQLQQDSPHKTANSFVTTTEKTNDSFANIESTTSTKQKQLEDGDGNEETIPLNKLLIENRRIWKYPLQGQTRRYYSNPNRLQELVALGPHFWTTQSPCRIARWFYPTIHAKPRFRDCSNQVETADQKPRRLTVRTLSQLEDGDTIYVTFLRLQDFVTHILDLLTVDVVILSGQIQKVSPIADETILRLLSHPRVLHWFCQNPSVYGGPNKFHAKLSPLPYGLKEVIQLPETLNQPLQAFVKMFLESLEAPIVKNETIFSGFVGSSTPLRAALIQEQLLAPDEYMRRVAQSQYILSPNGDRPECFRHYEAIGLGTIPITELDPFMFRHLREAPIVFNTTDWNLQSMQYRLPTTTTTTTDTSMVNRNLVLEEYWMEYMDWTVGRLLTWWNVEGRRPMLVPELFYADHVV